MRSYLFLFIAALVFALGLTPLVRRWALHWGAVDMPDEQRRIHARPTPRLGGMAVYAAFLAALALVPLLGNAISQDLRANWPTVALLLTASTLIFALGVYDDFRGASATLKIAVQMLAALFLYSGGFRISFLSSPLGGSWELPWLLSFPLTALWIVGITNAFNLIDGLDGLAAGASGFALISLFLCSLAQGHPEVSLLSIILIGAVLGFLRYNFNPATIFLGDSGSLLLGFLAAALSLVSTQKSSTLIAIAIPLVSFGLPVTEVGLSLSRRFLSGAPLFQGDRRHIHHMLLHRGLTQRQVAILLYGICALFSLFGLMLLNPHRNTLALIFFVLGVSLALGVRQLGYAEFAALGRHIQHGVKRRRHALAAGARWLEILEDLRAAQNIEELVTALAALCDAQGFAAVRLEVWGIDLAAPHATSANDHPEQARLQLWQWPSGEQSSGEPELADQYWSLRLPLINDVRTIGALTLYNSLTNRLTNDKIALDLAQTSELLSAELSAALSTLCQQTMMSRRLQPSGDYALRSVATAGEL